jgi:glycerophosphoryl diester phosphodiesterase
MRAKDILAAMYTTTPLIFAHSGSQAYAPPNTLPAFERAAEQQAHGTELDVHLTRDGHVVVIHDFTVDAATDGTGVVAAMTLAELKRLDAGRKFGPGFAGTPIPTLDEVFQAVGQRLLINVEIKSHDRETNGIEQAVADCIVRHDMAERVFVSSFNPLALRRLRAILPEIPLGFLYGHDSPPIAYALIEGFEVEAIHPQASLVTPECVTTAHNAGQRVHTWTVNEDAQAIALRDMGVDCIITDAPDRICAALA